MWWDIAPRYMIQQTFDPKVRVYHLIDSLNVLFFLDSICLLFYLTIAISKNYPI